jgi:crotonobetainyl-CoA:carnitine CoA-transferase CaiB-like acyl-CoA transferase
MGSVPALGEHTEAVLSGIGMSAAEIAKLRDSGAI